MTEAGSPLDVGLLRPGVAVLDLIYHPANTPLLTAAAARGAAVANGLGMLVDQAAHAVRLWTGLEPPVEAMRRAALAALTARAAQTD
jgi:shikimate dehydrogenase